jgi:hypothetical protein
MDLSFRPVLALAPGSGGIPPPIIPPGGGGGRAAVPTRNWGGMSTLGNIDPPRIFRTMCETSTDGAEPSTFHPWLVRNCQDIFVSPHHIWAPAMLVICACHVDSCATRASHTRHIPPYKGQDVEK